ncbi:hypothetical protein EGW08_004521 [Elysia chlorotica]|uniref:Uncharacterized protein n=1 Tax=Elysia chlorotica TaxID=188477 RepID=A0A433U1J2_ELYCH|nr:hypothetical protein EGW08_004521 [Elysia chlorotica]
MRMKKKNPYLLLVFILNLMMLGFAFGANVVVLKMNLIKDRTTTYTNYPIQGECKAKVLPHENFTLEISNTPSNPGILRLLGKYVIGKSVHTVRELENATVETTSDTSEGDTSVFFRTVHFKMCALGPVWDENRFGHVRCYVHKSERPVYNQPGTEPVLTDMSTTFGLQYKGFKPILNIKYHVPPNYVLVEDILEASCRGDVGYATGALVILLDSPESFEEPLVWRFSWTGEADSGPSNYTTWRKTIMRGSRRILLSKVSMRVDKRFDMAELLCFTVDLADKTETLDPSIHNPVHSKTMRVIGYNLRPSLRAQSRLGSQPNQVYSKYWLVEGYCHTLISSESMFVIFRIGNSKLLQRYGSIGDQKQLRHVQGNITANILHVDLTPQRQKKNIYLKFRLYMNYHNEKTSISCGTKYLMLCRTFSSSDAIPNIDNVKSAYRKGFFPFDIFAASMVGVMTCLFITLVIIKVGHPSGVHEPSME